MLVEPGLTKRFRSFKPCKCLKRVSSNCRKKRLRLTFSNDVLIFLSRLSWLSKFFRPFLLQPISREILFWCLLLVGCLSSISISLRHQWFAILVPTFNTSIIPQSTAPSSRFDHHLSVATGYVNSANWPARRAVRCCTDGPLNTGMGREVQEVWRLTKLVYNRRCISFCALQVGSGADAATFRPALTQHCPTTESRILLSAIPTSSSISRGLRNICFVLAFVIYRSPSLFVFLRPARVGSQGSQTIFLKFRSNWTLFQPPCHLR